MSAASAAARAFFLEGNALLAAGDAAAAEERFRRAVQAAPDLAEAHANLAWLLERRDGAQAESAYRRALALAPDIVQLRVNFGAFLARNKRFEESEAAYRQAIALDEGSDAAWSNLGVLLACLKREPEAEACYRRAIACNPAGTIARFNLGYLLLRQGRFEEGWPCLEARKGPGPFAAQLSCPRWRGEPLEGKRLLVEFEAGHGDMIQFCRYAKVLKQAGAWHLAMVCHPALKALFATLEGVDELVSFDEPLSAHGWDYWTPILGVPRYCGTTLERIPARLPYLRADPQRVAQWAPLLPTDGALRVGLVWKGNPHFENDADRSLPALGLLAPLWAVPGVRFVSLQKGAGEREAAAAPAARPLLALGARLGDFADTAAVIAQLDLLICVDTAVAHLAGALGRRCWVLLPDYRPDWRWLADRGDSPWYPGVMRLFRQSEMGDWEPTIRRVAQALAQFAQQGSAIDLR